MSKNKIWWGMLFRILSIIAVLAPLCIWFYINREIYFAPKTSSSMGIGLMTGMFFAILLLIGIFKDMDKRMTVLVVLLVSLALVWFLKPLMNDIFWILLCCIIGYSIYLPLSSIASRLLKHYSTYREERVCVEARREANRDANEVFM